MSVVPMQKSVYIKICSTSGGGYSSSSRPSSILDKILLILCDLSECPHL